MRWHDPACQAGHPLNERDCTCRYTRVYRPGDQLAHLRENVAPAEFILCREFTDDGDMDESRPATYECADWLGTGSQEEYETAAGLPLCRTCARRTGLDGN